MSSLRVNISFYGKVYGATLLLECVKRKGALKWVRVARAIRSWARSALFLSTYNAIGISSVCALGKLGIPLTEKNMRFAVGMATGACLIESK
jgi:hypothetical protein